MIKLENGSTIKTLEKEYKSGVIRGRILTPLEASYTLNPDIYMVNQKELDEVLNPYIKNKRRQNEDE